MTDTVKHSAKKRMTTGESVLLAQTPNDRYRNEIEFLHAVKRDYGSAANAAKVAIQNWDVYQDWKASREADITASRNRSPSGQFVSEEEQKCRLVQ